MKTITFTVQIQADCNGSGSAKKAIALRLCHDINIILTKYEGMTGGAQIIPMPKNINVSTTTDASSGGACL